MTRTPVSSSQIKSVGYNDHGRLLEVEFSTGDVYQYSDVPPGVYESLMDADSVGSVFHKIVKGRFGHKKI